MADDEEKSFPDDYFQFDKEDLKSILKGFPNQVKLAYSKEIKVEFEGNIDKVIITGMGGSAIAGDILKTYLEKLTDTPIIVNRNYDLPESADKNTLVVVSSYSGNTEETISAYKDALRKYCKILVITSGGRIAEMALSNRNQKISLPMGLQPRAALAYSFFPILKTMAKLRIIENPDAAVDRLAKALDKKIFEQTGLQLSEKLHEKVLLIYSSEMFSPVSYRWKTQFNENSKTMAFNNVFSELNHNELASLENMNADFHCIILRTDMDPHRIVKRMEITKDIYRKKGIDVTDIKIKGENFLTKLFSGIFMGDWTSYYLALRYHTDPTPVKNIENFKKELGAFIS